MVAEKKEGDYLMKKMIAIMLALALSSTVASAALQISVGEIQNPVDSEITLNPSDHIQLNIWTNEDLTGFSQATWMVGVSTGSGTIDHAITPAVASVGNIIGDHTNAALDTSFTSGVFGGYFAPLAGIAAGTALVNYIDFHCDGPGDVLIKLVLINNADGTIITVEDELIIHQIPEPMTMSLLGLGGLALIRRRRRA